MESHEIIHVFMPNFQLNKMYYTGYIIFIYYCLSNEFVDQL